MSHAGSLFVVLAETVEKTMGGSSGAVSHHSLQSQSLGFAQSTSFDESIYLNCILGFACECCFYSILATILMEERRQRLEKTIDPPQVVARPSYHWKESHLELNFN